MILINNNLINFNLHKLFSLVWNESYTKSSSASCALCSKMDYNIIILVMMTVWTMISINIAINS